MRRRVFWSILLVSFIVLAVSVSVVMITVANEFEKERKAEIRTELSYISAAYEQNNIKYLETVGKQSNNRITLISPDGTVLYDSYVNAATLGNHSDRPEIIQALKSGTGESERQSDTLSEKTFYYAVKLENGNVLRIAATVKSVIKVFDSTASYIFLVVAFALAIAAISAGLLTKLIIRPINAVDPERPLESICYDELSPLLVRIDKQNRKIVSQLEELSAKQREFSEITEGMSEALVIFGRDKKVLSANGSARRLFSLTPDSLGADYVELCRDMKYIRATESAFGGAHADIKLTKDGRIYRVTVNPVRRGDGCAAVLFASDITSLEKAEQMRREFSANVSHELKTPLTSILGCAEIMQNGIAKPEDFPRFTKQIYGEAKRLLLLINDIIRLSRLDEDDLKREFAPVDLYTVSERAVAELSDKAKTAGVTVELKGEHLSVNGIENTLHEMIYNLCDNAIAYNRRGGGVTVTVASEDGRAVLTVKDTGIGIAPEYQDRIFERFYRVDKSRSKETGGTGLGLSIVKHGALLHNAEILLTSIPDSGTEISLVFQQ